VQLLVSVRTAAEARLAIAAGVDLVDAKEPRHGALSPVSPRVLAAIARAVPDRVPLSLALGESRGPLPLRARLASRAACLHGRRPFLKFALSAATLEPPLAEADALRDVLPGARIVVAAFADRWTAPLEMLAACAAEARADAVLLDTVGKRGDTLFDHVTDAALVRLVAAAHARGLWVALAGSIARGQVERVARLGADVMGVRGAACEGGRTGELNLRRLRDLVELAAHGPAPTARAS
jgi:uncharacterized protein (UPF0264 family)